MYDIIYLKILLKTLLFFVQSLFPLLFLFFIFFYFSEITCIGEFLNS